MLSLLLILFSQLLVAMQAEVTNVQKQMEAMRSEVDASENARRENDVNTQKLTGIEESIKQVMDFCVKVNFAIFPYSRINGNQPLQTSLHFTSLHFTSLPYSRINISNRKWRHKYVDH
jgi:hypothetical protein